MTETRNQYGFPVVDKKLDRAKEIAEAARKRIAENCNCAECVRKDMAPAVEQLIKNWSRQ